MADLPAIIPKPPPKRAPTLYFIIGVKALKGIVAAGLAIFAHAMTDNNLPEDFRRLLEFFHIDPEKKFFLDIANQLSEVTAANLNWLAIGSAIYAAFMFLQAVGLVFRVGWIVWLVIGESAFFIPIEIYELVRHHATNTENRPHLFAHPKIGVAIVLAVNVAIVWYLFKNRARIIRHHHFHLHRH